ncbi:MULTISPECIES: substrate-binding domain-containing protein [Pseudorhizobium]|jgi:phosphate transport system substrate-binding protein|uniref:Phosphonate ABC transporter substrate-binding protein n=1 Tax=Pseudorhizobium pelagicum TaxID=1509405 RepID=A0A922P012_9HYPH|nr:MULTISPECIES: substrate-binding domain-containing protein [Pseudorhizobium]MBU1317538.1 substrate-binding domain-containing protein [Alphaproteobacteria bacterium]MDY6962330.1 substrate-binding domain-containing protein [Pseudomonadota bacterium]KEQ04110.1 phosphonate ABC transporter substrate-binding protein [Pseudorhizobium pelagicum]KEQ04996.1 phosphonate ABC transporter substrate-binding protein [Pseudorhizobium pelagicum]MBU1551382.1 substrate-binding domain-containing protein [Alphapr|tara:strand:- start:4891 stop:5931 length:1041 start_codon:yes stop_codon:yes gene_type:complete
MKKYLGSCAVAAIMMATSGVAAARDQIQIAGSSTVLPYASIVAEAFGENFEHPTPVVESGGSGAGRKKLCEGVGENTIDIANSSSRISQSDIDTCKANGVAEIQEVRIGYDGIVFASDINGAEYAFTPADWHAALAAKVVKDGKLVENPNKNWSDIRSDLPEQPILAFIPGTKHGTREVFDEKVIVAGCEENGTFEALAAENAGDKKAAAKACMQLRTDGVSVDIDGDYTETLSRIDANKNAIGVFGLSFYQNNTDKLRVATMGGVEPTVETIAAGEYPVSRPLYFYVKNAHLDVIPGLQEYVEFFVSDEIAGPNGPLAEYGLVSDPELAKTQEAVKNRTPMGSLN